MDKRISCSRYADSMKQAFLWALPLLTLLLVLNINVPAVIHAQVVTHITPTTGSSLDLGTHADTVGSTTEITGGTRPNNGTNLFHSFDLFTLGTGDTAHFLNDMHLPTTNIFGRVIGGEMSTIDGTLRTNTPGDPTNPLNFGSAHLWIVNPSGVLLGPDAHLDVGGPVTFTTADYLRFDVNGTTALFDMLSTPASLGPLEVAPVLAFGFLPLEPGATRGTITVEGSNLQLLEGQALSLVGGNISIQGFTLPDGTVQPAQLSVPNGTIQLASSASPGEFSVPPPLQSIPNGDGTSFASFESVFLTTDSIIGSSTSTVFIKDGQIVLSLNDATLNTSGVSSAPPVTDTIVLSPGSSIVTSSSGLGAGADVQFIADKLNLNGSAITTETLGDGIGGNITADVGKLTLAGASLNSNNFSFGIGQGGTLTIQGHRGADSAADSVMLSNGSVITTQTISFEHGGDVVIAAGEVDLDASTISTRTFGDGKGGDVQITADSLKLENGSSITTETTFLGKVGGDLLLNVGALNLFGGQFGGSQILSTNSTAVDLDGDGIIDVTGKGGNITIQGNQGPNSAADSMVLSGGSGITSEALSGSGGGGNITIRSTFLDLKEASFIKSSTSGIGTDVDNDGVLDDLTNGGGNILVNVQNLRVVDGSTISSSTNLGEALAVAGGTVTVEGLEGHGSKAGSVLLSDQSSGVLSASAAGVPGDITVNARTLTITNGAVISTGSAESGPAGSVGIIADSVVISAEGQIFSRSAALSAGQVNIRANELTLDNGSIVTRTFSERSGKGGNVELNVIGTLNLTNRASVNSQSETFSNGGAGDITMNVGSLTLANHSEITSSSKGIVADAGDAGNITIHSGSTVVMDDSSITTEASQSSGGRVTITAPEMIRLTNSQVSTSVAGSETDTSGGDISIDPNFVILQNSQILAQAFAGTGGNINIVSNVFLADPLSLVDASSQLGVSGTVDIRAPVQNLSGDLVVMSEDFASAAALLAQQCAARVADGTFSTFVVASREGLPVEPGGFLPSPSFLTELGGLTLSSRLPQPPLFAAESLFTQHDARPLQIAKLGSGCRK